MSGRPHFQVDAFTDEPFRGNPAGVVLLDTDDDPRDTWMQAVASELGHSETAFARPQGDGDPLHWGLRWFTPTTEVDLCGHATLATAHVLRESGRVAPDAQLRFETESGPLLAGSRAGRIELDLPAVTFVAADVAADLSAALGAEPIELHESAQFLCADLVEATEVAILRPDLEAIAALDVDAVIVTALAQPDAPHDFVSRVFAPRLGIPEDPVTGSAHCLLGPLWGERLDRTALVGYQVSARTGTVHVTLDGERVGVAGHAVTVTHGEIRI